MTRDQLAKIIDPNHVGQKHGSPDRIAAAYAKADQIRAASEPTGALTRADVEAMEITPAHKTSDLTFWVAEGVIGNWIKKDDKRGNRDLMRQAADLAFRIAALSAPTPPTAGGWKPDRGAVARELPPISSRTRVFEVVDRVIYTATADENGKPTSVEGPAGRVLWGDEWNARGTYLGRRKSAEVKRVIDAILSLPSTLEGGG